MESGEAKPIVIFEKLALGRFSFLIAILQYEDFNLYEHLPINSNEQPFIADGPSPSSIDTILNTNNLRLMI
jgi:hypothetical protein